MTLSSSCTLHLRLLQRAETAPQGVHPSQDSILRPLQQPHPAGPAAALLHCPTALSVPPAPGPTESSEHSSGQLPWCLHRREDKRPKLRHLRLCCWVPEQRGADTEVPHSPERVKSYRMEESGSRTTALIQRTFSHYFFPMGSLYILVTIILYLCLISTGNMLLHHWLQSGGMGEGMTTNCPKLSAPVCNMRRVSGSMKIVGQTHLKFRLYYFIAN